MRSEDPVVHQATRPDAEPWGESGCGNPRQGGSFCGCETPVGGGFKTLTAKDIMALAIRGGLHKARLDMQMIFQDPVCLVNPQMQRSDQVAEPIHNYARSRGRADQTHRDAGFDRVELPRSFMRVPHEVVRRAKRQTGGDRTRLWP